MSPLIIISIIAVILIVILFIPIGVGAKYESGAFVIVKVAFWKYDISINRILKMTSKKEKDNEKTPKKELDNGINWLDFILSLFGDFRRFVRKHFTLTDFSLKITVGTAEAASTAVSTGMIWSLAYNLLALFDKLVYVKEPKVEVEPKFNEATFSVSAGGIITTNLAYIIATAIVFAYKLFKYKRIKTRRKTL